MIRASTGQRPAPYVCAACRQQLSSSRVPASRLPWTPRYFSSTASRLDSKGGPKSKTSLGVFGGGAKFGGFGRKAPAASGLGDGLLPHERLARAKAPPPPQPPPPPPPASSPSKSSRKNRAKDAKRSSPGDDGTGREGPQTPPQGQQAQPQQRQTQASSTQRAKSLAELFNSERKPIPPQTPSSWATGEAEPPRPDIKEALNAPKRGLVDRSKPHWGMFKNRKSETSLPTSPAAAKAPTKDTTTPTGKDTSGDFWAAFDKRVQGTAEDSNVAAKDSKKSKAKDTKSSRQASRFGAISWNDTQPQAPPNYEAWQPTPQPVEEASVGDRDLGRRRGGRFEDEGEDSRDGYDKKSKKREHRQHQLRRQNADEGEAEVWERRERRRVEKEARKAQEAQQAAEEQLVPIFLPEFIDVGALAKALRQTVRQFLTDLETMGFEDLTEDTIMTGETAALIAMEYGFEPTVDDGSSRDLRPRPPPEDVSLLPSRPPVVTIMGHVDHGKTTLLDYLRKSSVAAQEHGGITQHIGAFIVQMTSGKAITFLDTPGHAAFLSMRQRGANVTDIVVLVVAADDSVKPQTLEALKHATSAKVPIIVAINKVDKEDARIDQVKADLSRHGVEIEDFGGDVQVVCVSGKTGQGMSDLEENIVTLSEVLDVRAETDGLAEGWILESSIKPEGKAATVLVKRGTLRPGDIIVAGTTVARIRILRNEAGVDLKEVPPGTPVEIFGWRELPEAGQQILQAPDESAARTAVEYRQEISDREDSSKQLADLEKRQREEAAAKEAAAEAARLAKQWGVEESELDETKDKEPGVILKNFVVRADVAGSVEAVCASVLEQGNNEVRGKVLRASTGQITESDVDLAAATDSILINFSSPILPHVKDRANQAKVPIIDHSVIYHLIDDVRAALGDLLPPLVTHRVLGEADVAQTFDINIKSRVYRTIAGCKVRNGSIKANSLVKVLRGSKVIYDGKINTLKHVKKDVAEMGKGSECGIGFEDFQDLKADDQVQTYEIVKEKRRL